MEIHAAGILFGLAAAVFATLCAHARRAVALALVLALALALDRRYGLFAVEPSAFSAAAAAALALMRPRWLHVLAPAAAGVSSAAWVSVMQLQGLPWPAAALAASAVALAAVGLAARRPGFATADVRDEALLLVALFALLLAVGPGVVDGWRSAVTLTAEPLAAGGPSVGPWLGATVVAAVLLGGAYSLWKRR